MASLVIPITKLRDDAVVPSYAYPSDAGVDLRAVESVSLAPFERALVPTGLAIAIPEGYAGFVQPRSGLAIKQGVTVLNTPGLIDSHYRGELKVALINLDAHSTFEMHRTIESPNLSSRRLKTSNGASLMRSTKPNAVAAASAALASTKRLLFYAFETARVLRVTQGSGRFS